MNRGAMQHVRRERDEDRHAEDARHAEEQQQRGLHPLQHLEKSTPQVNAMQSDVSESRVHLVVELDSCWDAHQPRHVAAQEVRRNKLTDHRKVLVRYLRVRDDEAGGGQAE